MRSLDRAISVVTTFLVVSSLYAGPKDEVKGMTEKILAGEEVEWFVETDPVKLDDLEYFSKRKAQLDLENHGFYDENIFTGVPRILGVDTSTENITFWDNAKTRGRYETWISKVELQVIGNIYINDKNDSTDSLSKLVTIEERLKNNFYTAFCSVYSKPEKCYLYFVFLVDPNDRKLKYVGRYPYKGFPARGIGFISLDTFMKGTKRYKASDHREFKKALSGMLGRANQ